MMSSVPSKLLKSLPFIISCGNLLIVDAFWSVFETLPLLRLTESTGDAAAC